MSFRTIPLDERHLANILRWLEDESLRDHLGTIFPISWPRHQEWFRNLATDRTQLVQAIERRTDQAHVGMIGLTHIDLIYRNAELWLYVGETDQRGSGAAREAFEQTVAFAFRTLGLHRVFVQVFDFNRRAQRFFEKCGMRREGQLREAVFKRGRFWDKHVFGMLANEFAPETPLPTPMDTEKT